MAGGLLEGLRVLEVGHPLTEYAGLIWAGLGAEVWLVESPSGAATRQRRPRLPNAGDSPRGSAAFLARNVGKKSVVVDPDSADGLQLLRQLCRHSDVVFDAEGSAFSATLAAFADGADAQVAVTITDRLRLGCSSIVGFAASGGMASSGWPHQPPCNAPSWLALDGAGVYAATMAAAGVFATRRRGRSGGGVRYEIPYEEAAVAAITPWTRCLHSYEMQAAGQGTLTARLGPNGFPIYETKDGYVRILAGTPKQWRAFVALLGEPEEIVSGPFSDPEFRVANADALKLLCAELIRQRSSTELFLDGQKLGLTISPVNSLRQFRADDHVRTRRIFASVEDPEFGTMELVRAPQLLQPEALNVVPTPAPGLGEHGAEARALAAQPLPESPPAAAGEVDAAKPLAGLRVLNLGVGAVVPEAAALLALLGAEVVKVESLAHVDFLRRNGLNGAMDVNNSPTFNQLNLGVQSLAVDMRHEEGVQLVQQLAAQCDVIMENMRGPVAGRWGLDYDGARRLREDIVCWRSQGLGGGPYDGFQTYGPNLQTFSGITHQWSHPDDPFPVGTTLNHPDHIAGKQSLVAVIAALLRRERIGKGCLIDAAQVETAAFLIGDRYVQQFHHEGNLPPLGNASPDMAPHGCYRCADDEAGNERWLALAVESDAAWQRFVGVVPGLADAGWATAGARLADAETIDAAVQSWARQLPVAEAEGRLREAGVAASRVVTGDDMAVTDSPFFAALGHPTSGTRRYTGVPVRIAGKRLPLRRPPLLGEHTEHVLHDVLRCPAEEVERLTALGAVGR